MHDAQRVDVGNCSEDAPNNRGSFVVGKLGFGFLFELDQFAKRTALHEFHAEENAATNLSDLTSQPLKTYMLELHNVYVLQRLEDFSFLAKQLDIV